MAMAMREGREGETGRLTVRDLSAAGKYVTRNEYTADQQAEIVEMLRMALRVVAKSLGERDLELYDVTPVDRKHASCWGLAG